MSDLFGAAEDRNARFSLLDPESHNGAAAVIYPQFLTAAEADRYFDELRETLDWQQREIVIYGKRHLQPRLVAWYGDAGTEYRYSGQTMTPLPWVPALVALREKAATHAGIAFNSVLANLYRDGQDAMGWHADDEAELGPTPVIASISLGAERRFDLRHQKTGETVKAVLPHGSLLIMAGTTQRDWKHQIARTKRVQSARINLTYRQVAC